MTSVKSRLVVTVGLLACAAIVAVALALRQGARVEFFRFQDLERQGSVARLHGEAQRLAARVEGRCCPPGFVEAVGELPAGRGIAIVDGTGSLLVSTGPALADLQDVRAEVNGSTLRLGATRQQGRWLERIQLQFDGTGVPLTLENGAAATLYLIGIPTPDSELRTRMFLGSLDRTILWVTVVFGLVAVGLTWLTARRALRPVDDLRAAARAIARGELSHRAPVTSRDELGELARAFNTMAADLERQQVLRRNLLHDVAHELRTPLTALRCRIESITDGLAADPAQAVRGAGDEVVHLAHLVDDLQELALAEAGELRLDPAPAAVAPIIASALAAAGLRGDARMRVDAQEDIAVRADAVRLRQMLLNLLTNADRHTPADGLISVRARREGPEVIVEVANTGSTLDEGQRARVFDRFYRTDAARHRATGGRGLGLAIVKGLAEAQGGRVWVTSGETNVLFGIALPAGD